MVGDVVGGYVVKEALGSGRSGLLFLAVHPETGHQAVVQRRLGEDDLQQFAAEAAQALALAAPPHVERRRSRAGLSVLLAVVDAGAPGTGYTEHTNTERLPDLPRRAPRRRFFSLALAALVLLGAAFGALLMKGPARQTEAPSAVPAQTAAVQPAPAAAAENRPSGAEASNATEKASPEREPQPSPGRPRVANAGADDGSSSCDEADVDWKPRARADLNELLQRAAKHDELVLWAADEEEAIARGIAAATTRANCSAIQRRLRRFLQRIRALERVERPPTP